MLWFVFVSCVFPVVYVLCMSIAVSCCLKPYRLSSNLEPSRTSMSGFGDDFHSEQLCCSKCDCLSFVPKRWDIYSMLPWHAMTCHHVLCVLWTSNCLRFDFCLQIDVRSGDKLRIQGLLPCWDLRHVCPSLAGIRVAGILLNLMSSDLWGFQKRCEKLALDKQLFSGKKVWQICHMPQEVDLPQESLKHIVRKVGDTMSKDSDNPAGQGSVASASNVASCLLQHSML